MIKKIEYTDDDELIILDQTLLPVKEKYLKTKDYEDVIDAIKKLKVRGAPLIGIAAAYGVVLGLNNGVAENLNDYEKQFYSLLDAFRKSRPTARNLFYAMDRIEIAFRENKELTGRTEKEIIKKLNDALLDEADRIFEEDIEMCKLREKGYSFKEIGKILKRSEKSCATRYSNRGYTLNPLKLLLNLAIVVLTLLSGAVAEPTNLFLFSEFHVKI